MISSLRSFALPLALSLAAWSTLGSPAQALPLIGIGASAGAYYWNLAGGNALDLDANVHFLPINLGANLVTGLGNNGINASGYLAQVELRRGIDAIPMLTIRPTLGYQVQNLYYGAGLSGPEGSIEADLHPLLAPVYFHGRLGASYLFSAPVGDNALVPDYLLGVGLNFTPFSSVEVRYRGYMPNGTNVGGVEVGLRLGL